MDDAPIALVRASSSYVRDRRRTTTHTARKTFIGNLYKQVKDPNLIASMSGHSEGSRAFARYRKIDDEMKKELVNLLD